MASETPVERWRRALEPSRHARVAMHGGEAGQVLDIHCSERAPVRGESQTVAAALLAEVARALPGTFKL